MHRNPILKIHKFVFLAEKALDRRLQHDVGLSFSQAMILVHVAHHPHISQRHVAYERDITPAAVSRHIEALVEAGLISRFDREQNKREHVLEVTLRGRGIVKTAEEVLEEEIDALMRQLSRDDVQKVDSVFDRLLSRFL
jgi:DNA-binding MarR family transcriptional regulator